MTGVQGLPHHSVRALPLETPQVPTVGHLSWVPLSSFAQIALDLLRCSFSQDVGAVPSILASESWLDFFAWNSFSICSISWTFCRSAFPNFVNREDLPSFLQSTFKILWKDTEWVKLDYMLICVPMEETDSFAGLTRVMNLEDTVKRTP